MEKTKTYSFNVGRKFKEKFEGLGEVLGVKNPLQHTTEIFEQALDIAVDLTLDDQYDRPI